MRGHAFARTLSPVSPLATSTRTGEVRTWLSPHAIPPRLSHTRHDPHKSLAPRLPNPGKHIETQCYPAVHPAAGRMLSESVRRKWYANYSGTHHFKATITKPGPGESPRMWQCFTANEALRRRSHWISNSNTLSICANPALDKGFPDIAGSNSSCRSRTRVCPLSAYTPIVRHRGRSPYGFGNLRACVQIAFI